MKEHIRLTIEELKRKIERLETEIIGYKQTANLLADGEDEPPVYLEAELRRDSASDDIKPDTFYGQPLNTSIRKILELRKARGDGPATVRDIYDALIRGGYLFMASNDENAMRGLRISLGKSTNTFHKLPNGSFGLLTWYPEVKPARSANGDDSSGGQDAQDDDGDETGD